MSNEVNTTIQETHGSQLPHAVPAGVLLGVWAMLMVLTAATVAITYLDVGAYNIILALGIATAKASLVALYFMHLRYDNKVFAIILIVALGFVTLFIAGTLGDAYEYASTFQPPPGYR